MEIKEDEQQKIKEWDAYTSGAFLKAEDVASQAQPFIVEKIEETVDDRNGQDVLRPHLKNENDVTYLFDLNKTNARALQNAGVNSPIELMGKVIKFRKVMVTNPTTKKEVEGLRIGEVR